MQGTRHLTLLTIAAAATAAIAMPADALAFDSACGTPLNTDAGTWTLQRDGTNAGSVGSNGQNFAQDHGKLTIAGAAYPEIPDAGKECKINDAITSITYPTRTLGGLEVTRQVTAVEGGIRHLDTIVNPTNAFKSFDTDFRLSVSGSQAIIESESGDAAADADDHWTVHENAGTTFPFLQWGQDDANQQPTVETDGAAEKWQDELGMPDGTLHYESIPINAGGTVRLVHYSGSGSSKAQSVGRASGTAKPFVGLNKVVASQVVNYGLDPDGDGVGKFQDNCPALGGTISGCPPLLAQPSNPPSGGGGTVAPTPVPPTPDPGPAPKPPVLSADGTAPTVTLSGLGSSVRRGKLTNGSVRPKASCSELCRITVKVQVRRKGASKATTVLTTKPTALVKGKRTIKLRVSAKALRKLAKQQVTVTFTAVDAAGNRGTLKRAVKLVK